MSCWTGGWVFDEDYVDADAVAAAAAAAAATIMLMHDDRDDA